MIKLSVEEIRDIIRPVGLSPMKSKGYKGRYDQVGLEFQDKVLVIYELHSLPFLF